MSSAVWRLGALAMVLAITDSNAAVAAEAEEAEVVEFRLTEWKSAHFEDEKKRDQYYKSLSAIGCEAEKDSHDGHFDVRYRCADWKKMTVATHALAHQWEKWLKKSGFETRHSH